MNRKQQVRALLESIASGDAAPVAVIDPAQYTQHNLAVADGLAGFGELMAQLPPASARVNVRRVFEDGDFVFTHTDYDFFGPKVGFDIFRFAGGRIVEHWDNLQTTPADPNPAGRTMLDGPTEATDLERTEENKALVRRFVEEVLVKGETAALADWFAPAGYLQHNPQLSDGLAPLVGLSGLLRYDRVHRVLGEGNFVLVVSEGVFQGQPVAFYDLFRVAEGRLAEHWDVIETIPARADWKNSNGKF